MVRARRRQPVDTRLLRPGRRGLHLERVRDPARRAPAARDDAARSCAGSRCTSFRISGRGATTRCRPMARSGSSRRSPGRNRRRSPPPEDAYGNANINLDGRHVCVGRRAAGAVPHRGRLAGHAATARPRRRRRRAAGRAHRRAAAASPARGTAHRRRARAAAGTARRRPAAAAAPVAAASEPAAAAAAATAATRWSCWPSSWRRSRS